MLVFLIGYMGCGKSSLGKPLARLMNIPFVDLDTLIEKEFGMSIPLIFDKYGERFFRKTESFELQQLCDKMTDAVISVGGGTPCFYDNMALMNNKGLTVFIDINAGMLASRLECSKKNRPLLEGKSKEELLKYVTDSLNDRMQYYKKAKIIVESKNLSASDLYNVIQNYH